MARVRLVLTLIFALPLLVGAAGVPTTLVKSVNSTDPRSTHTTHELDAASPADTVLVAARELRRGAVLRDEDIDTMVVSMRDMPTSWRTAAEQSVEPGWVTHRLIRKGEPLRSPAVAPPALIMSGEDVTLVWQVGELQVTRRGTAMGPGYLGDQLVVRVDATRRFTGTITGPGTVLVNGSP